PRSWTVATAKFTEFPTSAQVWYGLTAGPDGNVWFTAKGAVGRITPAGVITEFAMPGQTGFRITSGPDGNLWFTASRSAAPFTPAVGRMTPAGLFSGFDPPPNVSGIWDIAAGGDGNIWVTDSLPGGVLVPISWGFGIARVSTDGTFTHFDAANDSRS